MLADRPFRELLADFASPAPTPGGGSAAAAAAAVGAALLVMVASLPKTRSGSDGARTALADAARRLGELQRQLADAIDADAAAYARVVGAFRRPKGTDAEKAARAAAIQHALRQATETPLAVMRASAAGLALAETVAAHGLPAAASDVGVAIELLQAGTRGAHLNVDANLRDITDSSYGMAARTEASRLAAAADRAAAEATALLAG